MKVRARKGVTIVYAKKLDGRQVVHYIPPDRNAVIIWQDQFGSVHGAAFGDIDTRHRNFDRFVARWAQRYGMFAPREDVPE